MRNAKMTTALGIGTSLGLALTMATPATASDASPSAADAVAAVSPEIDQVVAPTASGAHLTAVTESADTISIPTSGDGAVTIAGTESSLGIKLPSSLTVSDPVVSPDGSVVYSATDPASASLAVQALEDGTASIQTVLESADAPTSYTYELDGDLTAQLTEDGGIDILAAADIGLVTVGQVQAPWAYDATGAPIETHYITEGSTFTQVIETPAEATYPIVADPTFGHTYLVPTAYLNKAETKQATDLTGMGLVCTGVTLVAGPLGALCGANVAALNHNAKAINARGKCMKILLGPGVVAGTEYTGGNCK